VNEQVKQQVDELQQELKKVAAGAKDAGATVSATASRTTGECGGLDT
jgi:hypothetical protein